ncbi:MAG: hypothetical protein E3J87_02195 [Candidatus Cloacimonadota bacterium]|nr:MAG: hypothetical protein E3J87_02195 [Candidatus Cloacimonadota bacterium]
MKTTRDINVILGKGKIKLRHVTTKDIDVGVRVEPPKTPIKTKSITTTTLADVADIAEKKRRDDIAKERKLAMKDEKKIVIAEKETTTEPMITITHPVAKDIKVGKITTGEYEIDEEKKPWNKMNAKERKEYQAEKAKEKK